LPSEKKYQKIRLKSDSSAKEKFRI